MLAACVLTGCTSASSDITQEIKETPPSAAGPGQVTIWMSSPAPVVPTWPRVKSLNARVTQCSHDANGPNVSAITDDRLPVAIRVLDPTGEEARLVAFIQYAPDGSPPPSNEHDEQLLIVSDLPFPPARARDTQGDFTGGFTHAPANESPPVDSSGTIAHVSWQCPSSG